MVLATHGVDLDGLGSIIISEYFGLPFNHYVLVSYDEEKDDNGKYVLERFKDIEDTLVFTDFHIDKEHYKALERTFKTFYIFDHHKSTEELFDKPNVFYDDSKSGTLIYYEWLMSLPDAEFNPIVDHFVKLVNTYDMWKSGSILWDDAVGLNNILWSAQNWADQSKTWHRYKFFINMQVEKMRTGADEWFWTAYERNQIAMGKKKVDDEYKKAIDNIIFRTDGKGRKFAIYQGSSKISLVCNMILKENDIDYVIAINTFNADGPNKVDKRVSVRSKPHFNVRSLAGVDGHEQAGGAMYPKGYLNDLLSGKIPYIPYKRQRSSDVR